MAHITSLFVYPVKSCRGVSVQKAYIAPTGLRFDRTWVVVTEEGQAITQRTQPRLALVEIDITPHSVLTSEAPSLAGAELVLRAAGMPELRVPLGAPGPGQQQQRLVPIKVWEWAGKGADEGPAAADWLTKYLGVPARLVRFVGHAGEGAPGAGDPTRRQVDPSWAPGAYETAFSDAFPFLLATEASLGALNASLANPIPINRFRPNILVGGEGVAAWEEDSWRELRLGSSRFESVKPCDRCQVPTINQETGIKSLDVEPTETLHKLRSGAKLGWGDVTGFKHAVFFGWNLVTKDSGRLAVGDPVEVLSRREGVPQPTAA